MSSQQNSNNKEEECEIWNSLFGDKQKIGGHTTLITIKDKNNRISSKQSHKKLKTESRSSSSRERSSSSSRTHHHHTSSSQANGSHRHRSHTNHSTHNQNTDYSTDGPSTAERLSQFLCTPKTRARLPPPPLQCKFLKYPHKKDRFTKFCATNLELNYKWQMHHDSLFPLPLDLMDPDYYNPLKPQYEYNDNEQQTKLNRKEDERILQLLEEREYDKNAKEEQLMPEQEAFLLQTQYLTGGQEWELTESQRKGYDDDMMVNMDRNNNRNRNRKRKRDWDDEQSDDDQDSDHQYYKRNNPHSAENVAATFVDIQNVSRHPVRNVEVEAMFDVFPHEGLLENDYTHVQFDKDPIYHTRKCQFMSKYEAERMKMAKLSTQSALLRCVNRKGLQMEGEEEEDDVDDDANRNEADWFSLYATNGHRKKSEYDGEDIIKYEWSAELVPVHMDRKKKMFFMVVPKGDQPDVYYANFNNRLSLRHKQTDSSQDNIVLGGKKGLSVEDKKFFKQQPMNIKLNVPQNDSQEY